MLGLIVLGKMLNATYAARERDGKVHRKRYIFVWISGQLLSSSLLHFSYLHTDGQTERS